MEPGSNTAQMERRPLCLGVLIASGGMFQRGLLKMFRNRGVPAVVVGCSVPEDVSVISGERSMLTEHLTPVVTSVELNKKEAGVQAVRMMMRRLEQPELPGSSGWFPFPCGRGRR